MSGASDNNSALVPIPRHDYAQRQINFSTSRPLPIHHKGARAWDPFPRQWFEPYSCWQPHLGFHPKAEGQISMTMEVSELLSWAALDTSGIGSGSSTPKGLGSLAMATLLPLKSEDFANLVDTSSKVSDPEDVEMDYPTLEKIHVSPPLWSKLWGLVGSSPMDVSQLQEEVNKAMGHLLVTRYSLDARWRKQVSDFGMALCQFESETIEAIKEVKALCA